MVNKETGVEIMEKEIMEKKVSQIKPEVSQKHQLLPNPRLEDYDDINEWQYAYDEWYRNQPGHCPNFAGHF